MKKTIMISMVLASAFLVGCGNASGPETVTGGENNASVASFSVVKGTYVVGDHYLDIDTNGKLTAYTYFAAAECVEETVMGEKNHALSGKTLTAKAKEFTLGHDGGHLVWAFTTDTIDKVKYLKGGSIFSSGSGLSMNDFAVGTTKGMLPVMCDANLTATTLGHKIVTVKDWYFADTVGNMTDGNTTSGRLRFNDNNLSISLHLFNEYNMTEFNVSKANASSLSVGSYSFSDMNETLKISIPDGNSSQPDENSTCTFVSMDVRAGNIVLHCTDDNTAEESNETLWTSMSEAFKHLVFN